MAEYDAPHQGPPRHIPHWLRRECLVIIDLALEGVVNPVVECHHLYAPPPPPHGDDLQRQFQARRGEEAPRFRHHTHTPSFKLAEVSAEFAMEFGQVRGRLESAPYIHDVRLEPECGRLGHLALNDYADCLGVRGHIVTEGPDVLGEPRESQIILGDPLQGVGDVGG